MFIKTPGRSTPGTIFALFFLILGSSLSSGYASGIQISPEAGKVDETRNGWKGQTIYLIQEAHVDYEGQKSIIRILESLIIQKDLRLILVEGGWGNVNLSDLRMYGTAEQRRKVADQYLKAGKISAEEYLDLTSDYHFLLQGIEDPKLYASNMEAFLKIHDLQPKALAALGGVEKQIGILSGEIYSKPLRELSEKRKAFEEQRISWLVYFEALAKGMPDAPAPALRRMLKEMKPGEDFDSAKADLEKRKLMTALTRTVSKIELSAVHDWLEVGAPKSQQGEYQALKELFEIADRYPKLEKAHPCKHLRKYLEMLKRTKDMDFRPVMKEAEQLEQAWEEKLAESEDAKQLLAWDREVRNLRKLFELKMTPDAYQGLGDSLIEKAWMIQTLQSHKLEVPEGFELQVQTVRDFIPVAKSFYEAAVQREKALVENTAQEMENRGDRHAVLISGGFHAGPIMEELHGKGYSVVNILPRFQPEDVQVQQEKYFKILKEKWESVTDQSLFSSKEKKT